MFSHFDLRIPSPFSFVTNTSNLVEMFYRSSDNEIDYLIAAPGATAQDVAVDVDDQSVRIEIKRSQLDSKTVHTSFSVNQNYDIKNAKVTVKDGVVKITATKYKKPENKVRLKVD